VKINDHRNHDSRIPLRLRPLTRPNSKLTIEEVRTAFSATYPEIATAAVTGPEAIGNKLVYHFAKAIGVKG
jgi:PRTRC genetic system protein C